MSYWDGSHFAEDIVFSLVTETWFRRINYLLCILNGAWRLLGNYLLTKELFFFFNGQLVDRQQIYSPHIGLDFIPTLLYVVFSLFCVSLHIVYVLAGKKLSRAFSHHDFFGLVSVGAECAH